MSYSKKIALGVALVAALACAGAEGVVPEGNYRGSYRGSAESSAGEIRLNLRQGAEGKWSAESGFTVSGQEVKCKSATVEVTGAKLKHACAWEAQGYSLETTMLGEYRDGKLQGSYRTVLAGEGSQVDEGTWSASTAGGTSPQR